MDPVFTETVSKLEKGNLLLFSKESRCLQDLAALMQLQSRRTIILWAFACAASTLAWFEEKYPLELRPENCLQTCEKWAKGEIKRT